MWIAYYVALKLLGWLTWVVCIAVIDKSFLVINSSFLIWDKLFVFSLAVEQVLALFSYTAQNEDELTFYKGSVINVMSREGDWWRGELNGQVGMFPYNYVQLLSDLPDNSNQCKWSDALIVACTLYVEVRHLYA